MESSDQRAESSRMGHLAWRNVMAAWVLLIDTPLIVS
jgi:hypothetical protein